MRPEIMFKGGLDRIETNARERSDAVVGSEVVVLEARGWRRARRRSCASSWEEQAGRSRGRGGGSKHIHGIWVIGTGQWG